MTTLEIWNFLRNLRKAKNLDDFCRLAETIKGGKLRPKMEVWTVNAVMPHLDSAYDAQKMAEAFRMYSGHHLVVREYAEKKGVDSISLHECLILRGLINLNGAGGQEAYEAVAKIAVPFLKIKEDDSIRSLAIKGALAFFLPERERPLFEDEIVEAAIKDLPNEDAAAEFSKSIPHFSALSNDLLVAFALSGKMTSLGGALTLLSALRSDAGIWSAILAIMEESLPLFKSDADSLSLNDLSNFARCVKDHKGDGSATAGMEDAIISAAIPLTITATQAASIAESFETLTGTHKFLIAYAAAREIPTEADAVALLNAVKSKKFSGSKAGEAIIEKAAECIPGLNKVNLTMRFVLRIAARRQMESRITIQIVAGR